MTTPQDNIPYGFCHCGCGQKTKLAQQGDTKKNYIKGKPNRYLCGHSNKGTHLSQDERRKKSESHTRHGHARHRFAKITATYRAWRNMIARCDPKFKQSKDYAGRGISVCDEWRSSFEAFLEHMGERPDDLTLDRKNNDGNYEPGNCRWATRSEQQRNRRSSDRIRNLPEKGSIQPFLDQQKAPTD